MHPLKSKMGSMPIDAIENLEQANVPPDAAKAIVKAITDHTTTAVSGLATKEDLEVLRVAAKHDFDDLRRDFDELCTATKHALQELGANIRNDLQKQIIELQSRMTTVVLSVFGTLLVGVFGCIYFVLSYAKK